MTKDFTHMQITSFVYFIVRNRENCDAWNVFHFSSVQSKFMNFRHGQKQNKQIHTHEYIYKHTRVYSYGPHKVVRGVLLYTISTHPCLKKEITERTNETLDEGSQNQLRMLKPLFFVSTPVRFIRLSP